MAAREQWLVRNLSTKNLGIGDLPRLPTLEPGQCLDLLRYHKREQAQNSRILVALVQNNWIGLTKLVDGHTPAKSDVEAVVSRLVARTLSSLDDTGVSGEIGFLNGAFYGYNGSTWVSLMPSWYGLNA